eukprot:CAMPEP_0172715456 /NCGR_PEP_ID=MMETSP1074-20121228/67557_1 /TAXON_ID=2916 /ORGANISM="Ceratium fusus, Strain PA161109" /LENGTH=151 /DNA_ID=CAMNT_0013540037 /DNA_START=993 /DNA_END=1449 /DNA_ORIENTATION=-
MLEYEVGMVSNAVGFLQPSARAMFLKVTLLWCSISFPVFPQAHLVPAQPGLPASWQKHRAFFLPLNLKKHGPPRIVSSNGGMAVYSDTRSFSKLLSLLLCELPVSARKPAPQTYNAAKNPPAAHAPVARRAQLRRIAPAVPGCAADFAASC